MKNTNEPEIELYHCHASRPYYSADEVEHVELSLFVRSMYANFFVLYLIELSNY